MSQSSRPGCMGRLLRAMAWLFGALIFLAAGIVIGMGATVETPQRTVAVPTYTSTPQSAVAVLLPTSTPLPTSTVRPTSTPYVWTKSDLRFLDEVTELMDVYSSGFSGLSDAMRRMGENTTLLFSDAWQREVVGYARSIMGANQRAQKMVPPPILESSWDSLLRAGAYYDRAMASLIYGVENYDVDSLNAALTLMTEGQARMDLATALMPD